MPKPFYNLSITQTTLHNHETRMYNVQTFFNVLEMHTSRHGNLRIRLNITHRSNEPPTNISILYERQMSDVNSETTGMYRNVYK